MFSRFSGLYIVMMVSVSSADKLPSTQSRVLKSSIEISFWPRDKDINKSAGNF